jgi:hypothetical protein
VSPAGSHGGVVLDVGDRKQLLLDDEYLVETSVRVRAVLRQPVKHGFPVLSPDKPWEEGGLHTGSIIHDQGMFKMWYGGLNSEGRTRCFCYATSRDGISWEKPSLGLFDWDGSKDNNIVMLPHHDEDNLGTACVFKDDHEAGEERAFKLVHHYIRKAGDDYVYGLQAATSPDGIRWNRIAEPLFTDYKPFDCFNIVFWDEFLESYVAYVRRRARRRFPREKRRFPSEPTALRSVGRAESKDFVHWTSPEVIVLGPGEGDPPESDYYGSGAFRYCDHAYLMMTPFFDHATDQVHLRLASSRDDVTWRLVCGRRPFIPTGDPQAWDSMQIYPLVPAVAHGDEVYIYYHGLDEGHYARRAASDEYRPNDGFGLATLPLDGFVSLQAGYLPGVVTTWPLEFSARFLFLNMEATPVDESVWGTDHGIAVEVLDEEGYPVPEFSRHDCDTLTEGGTRQQVTWNGRGDLSLLIGKAVKLRFYLQFAGLYSFQFSD